VLASGVGANAVIFGFNALGHPNSLQFHARLPAIAAIDTHRNTLELDELILGVMR